MMEKRIKENVGIDCSQNELVVSYGYMNEEFDCTILSNTKFKNQPEGFKKLVQWSKKLSQTDSMVTFVIEATGVYHERVALYLCEQGIKVSVVLPNKANAFFHTLKNKTVNDKSCAQMLTILGLEKKLDAWQPPNQVYNQLKQLTRERDQLIIEQTQNKNQLHAEQSGAWINKQSVKRVRQRIKMLEKQIEQIKTEIEEIINQNQWLQEKVKKVTSIKGVGLVTAATVIAETNGFNLIRNKKQLVSYAGLDVIEKQSGTSIHGKTRISHKGNKHLRKCLHFPALTAIRNINTMSALFNRLVNKHGVKMKAVVAVQRKLLELIYILWKKDEYFNINYKNNNLLKVEEQPMQAALRELA